MAPSRKETTIDLCKRVNAQGNTVSIRMLEYLSSTKEPVRGFFPLATTFLDLARLVWSIEAGINESFKTRKTYPIEITQELDKHFRHVYDEFVVLSQMVSKFIDNDNGKGGLGKRMRMMFADSEVDKVRMTLLKSSESLKMSSAIFRWTIGDDHADDTMSIGYAGLIAALERIHPTKTVTTPPQRSPAPTTSLPPVPPAKSNHGPPEGLLPPARLNNRPSLSDLRPTEMGGIKLDPTTQAGLLRIAIDNRDPDTASTLIHYGADANGSDGDGVTPLFAATQAASVDCARVLLKNGADANFKDNEGTTALFKAIQAGRTDIMAALLDHGANPNLPCPKHPLWPSCYHPEALALLLSRGADHKRTPGIMELAASLKKLESVKVLVEAGVSPNVRKDGAYTPLASAIRDNSADIVTYLLDHGADPNYKAFEFPTYKCITHKRTHFLPQLVAAGADLNTPKGIIETAVAHKDKDALIYLLDQGVNPNDRCPEGGSTALTTAIRENNIEFVDLLLKHGANPAVRGQDWPLCMAVKSPIVLKRLLAFPGINPRAFRGVVEMAVHAGQLESVKLLLGAGVSVEDKNCGVFSPLTTAIREGHKSIVRYLLDEAHADPNAPGEHLPLVKALRSYDGHDTEVIQMLLSRGANINHMHRGWNAVLQAVENSDTEILGLLVSLGGPVDLQAVDETGRPVIDIVGDRDWEEGLALLFPKSSSPKGRS
ncbi:hypothetical protein SLS59_002874 [Nothophoma quercina]|uniref:Ankyrin n=1 Tax=Nothophoma quercina TaxID=749835 RepID=A0ABR3RRX7_9PLEO